MAEIIEAMELDFGKKPSKWMDDDLLLPIVSFLRDRPANLL